MDVYAGLAPDFGRYVIEYPFGDIYARPGLDMRTRLLTAVAALAAVGDSEVPLGTLATWLEEVAKSVDGGDLPNRRHSAWA
ncbi:carboxymuconolactone decarboxylase family protein [Sorangium sp. So ce1667]